MELTISSATASGRVTKGEWSVGHSSTVAARAAILRCESTEIAWSLVQTP